MAESTGANDISSEDAAATPVYTEEGTRPPFFANIAGSINYMRQAANKEGAHLRNSDLPSVVLLPFSCLLLVAVSWFFTGPEVRAALFLLPLLAFCYYIGMRIGIVKGLTTRQAYLVWHILMATFLLGCTFTLFVAFLKDAVMNNFGG
jgi:hypothetical protein